MWARFGGTKVNSPGQQPTDGRRVDRFCRKLTAASSRKGVVHTSPVVTDATRTRLYRPNTLAAQHAVACTIDARRRIGSSPCRRRRRRRQARKDHGANFPRRIERDVSTGRLDEQRRRLEVQVGRVGGVDQGDVGRDADGERPAGHRGGRGGIHRHVVARDVESRGRVESLCDLLELGRRDAVGRRGVEVAGDEGSGLVGEDVA